MLEPIKGFDKAQNTHACIGSLVAQRVMHVEDLLVVEFPVEISTFDVNLVHLHVETIGHCNDGACQCKFGYWCVSVVVVDTTNLASALGDETSLVADDIASGILLHLEDPFRANDVGSGQCLLHPPSAGGLECGQLFLDGLLPRGPVRSVFRFSKRPGLESLYVCCLCCKNELHTLEVLMHRR